VLLNVSGPIRFKNLEDELKARGFGALEGFSQCLLLSERCSSSLMRYYSKLQLSYILRRVNA